MDNATDRRPKINLNKLHRPQEVVRFRTNPVYKQTLIGTECLTVYQRMPSIIENTAISSINQNDVFINYAQWIHLPTVYILSFQLNFLSHCLMSMNKKRLMCNRFSWMYFSFVFILLGVLLRHKPYSNVIMAKSEQGDCAGNFCFSFHHCRNDLKWHCRKSIRLSVMLSSSIHFVCFSLSFIFIVFPLSLKRFKSIVAQLNWITIVWINQHFDIKYWMRVCR